MRSLYSWPHCHTNAYFVRHQSSLQLLLFEISFWVKNWQRTSLSQDSANSVRCLRAVSWSIIQTCKYVRTGSFIFTNQKVSSTTYFCFLVSFLDKVFLSIFSIDSVFYACDNFVCCGVRDKAELQPFHVYINLTKNFWFISAMVAPVPTVFISSSYARQKKNTVNIEWTTILYGSSWMIEYYLVLEISLWFVNAKGHIHQEVLYNLIILAIVFQGLLVSKFCFLTWRVCGLQYSFARLVKILIYTTNFWTCT